MQRERDDIYVTEDEKMSKNEIAFEREWKHFLKGHDKYVKEHHNRFMAWLLRYDIPEHEKQLAELFFVYGIMFGKKEKKP